MSRLRSLAGVCLALATLGLRPEGQESTLAPILAGLHEARALAATVAQLVESARGEAAPLLEVLTATEPLTRLQRTALELALEEQPREDVLRVLRALAREQDTRRRVVALQTLERFGTRAEFALALELGAADTEAADPEERRSALRRTLRAILAREPSALFSLEELTLRADPSTRETCLRVIADAAGQDAAAHLAALLSSADAATRGLLLLEIARVARRGSGLDDRAVSEHVRDQLARPERSLAVLACATLTALHDHASIPDLVILLADSDANVRAQAHRSLCRLTGLELPLDEEAWLAWLDGALAWWDERSEPCRVALVSGGPADAAAALEELAVQRFRRDLVVQALELALQRSEPDLVSSALTALAAIDDPRAPLVLQRYRDEVPTVHAEALERAARRADRRQAQAPRPVLRPPQRKRNP